MRNGLPRILLVHNYYQQPGGEDAVVASEAALLEKHGHRVELYSRHNDEVGVTGRASLAAQTFWSRRTYSDIGGLIDTFQPDVIHAHNTFPLISGALYWVASKQRVPTVQTIHNFRLACIQAMFLRDGKICEDCLGRSPIRGILRKCYRGSASASLAAGASLALHRALGTYRNKIDAYITLNDFCRKKLIESGLPEHKIHIKPNFVEVDIDLPQHKSGNPLFVGRLSHEKGIDLLLRALDRLPGVILDVAGDGPLKAQVLSHNQVNYLGQLSPVELYRTMSLAPFLVMPSIWYENMPRTLVEAFACSTPVIASRLGALAELVSAGRNGWLFEPGSAEDLAKVIGEAQNSPNKCFEFGTNALEDFHHNYSGEASYGMLSGIYDTVLQAR